MGIVFKSIIGSLGENFSQAALKFTGVCKGEKNETDPKSRVKSAG